MRMMFVARSLDNTAGGLERMITEIMNAMVARGHHVALFTWDLAGAESFYPISPDVLWYKLDLGDPRLKAQRSVLLKRWAVARRLVGHFRPELVVCFQAGPFMAMRVFLAGMNIPLIAAERTAPTIYEHLRGSRHRFVEHQAFRTARLITVQFERYRTLYPAYLRGKIVAIPNPVRPARKFAAPGVPGPSGRFRLLSVGRLSFQKNMPVLIDAFAVLAPRFPAWDVRIVGEGEDRSELEDRIRSHGLVGRVVLAGVTKEIESEYSAANLFCLPARWEGFPNTLAEALAHGLPAVGFEGCAGVPDLIISGKSGVLASGNNDAESLAASLETVLGEHARRAHMGEVARASMEPYAPAQVLNRWERALLSVREVNR